MSPRNGKAVRQSRLRRALLLFGIAVAIVFCSVPLLPNHAKSQGEMGLDVSSSPWLDAQENDGIVYFVFQSPARIERYDMIAETWLDDILLSDTPTAFAVDTDGLYVSFGTHTSRFNLDGTGEEHLRNTGSNTTSLFTVNDFLYIYYDSALMSVNKVSGALISSKDYWYSMQGIDVAPTIGKAFARSTGVSPSDIVQVVLNSDGTLGDQSDSPYHGAFPGATKTFVFPGEARVADDSGIVYDTGDLSYSNSLAGPFDDMAFYGDLPIVIRDDTLVAYSNTFLETGQYTPDKLPLRIFVRGEFIFSFSFVGGEGFEVEKIPISLLVLPEPGEPVDPNGLAYVPDSVLLGQGEIVYLLSRDNLSIFPWSVSERAYLETIPLVEAPTLMAYSDETNRLYLAYPSGKITQIRLDESTSEESFVNSPQRPSGLATAGEYVFVHDPSGAWGSHYTYSPDGVLISQKDWNYWSREYVWSAANRKMYFFRDDTSPDDLLWEDIDVNGVIGAKQDSPYHSDEGIQHPIRVAPDGSIVVLGSGRIYLAISLEQIAALSNSINDAVWVNGTLFSLRALEDGAQLQKWGKYYGVEDARELDGSPTRMFPTEEGVLVITEFLSNPRFSIWDIELNEVYQSPVPPPAAEFTATPNSGVAPLAIEFNDNSTGNVTSWSWDFDNDGTVDSTERNPSHTYGTVGDYTVSLTVTGPGGSDTETKTDYIRVISFESALDQIQAEVSWWRGLAFLEEVNCGFMTQEEYRERVITELAKETDEINTTQQLWRFLDLMGQGQDLYDILVGLYSEGTAGFYDYELKELYVISNAEEMGPVEKVTFAHEYTHALQDQHFDLGSFLPSAEGDSDVYAAAQSLVEGDAEFLQRVYYWGSLDDAERAAYDQEMAEYDDSAFEAAPQILQEQFLFPYTSGVDFIAALWQEGGWGAVNQAYSDPPQSTEQILHPERYLNRDEPQAVSMPDLESALGTGWTQLDSDVMGELGMKVYLEAFIDTDEAAAAAAGWDGDRYVFLKDAESRGVLALSSIWDSVADASEFFDTYIDFVAEKSGGSWTLLQEGDGRRWWQTAGLSLYLGQAGSEVLIVMAPDAVVAGQVLSEFPEFYTATAPQADFSASLTQAIVGQAIEFADSSTGDINSWAWDFDHDGLVDSTEQNPSHSYVEPGTYTVSLTVSNQAAGDTETKVEYITVYTAPQADFSASLTQAAVGQTIEFADNSTGDINSWAWDFDHDGLVDSTEQNPSYTYPNPGKYTVSLKVTGPGGSDNEVKSDFVTVSAVSAPELAGINPSSGRQGETLTVTISGENLAEVSAIIFGQEITVNGFTVDSTTQITANITIGADAATGPRDVSVTTLGGTGSLPSRFTVDKAVKSGGGLFDCGSCSSSKKETSVAGLLIGWVAVGFAGGTGYYLVRRAARSKRTRSR